MIGRHGTRALLVVLVGLAAPGASQAQEADAPARRAEWFLQQRLFPLGRIPAGARLAAIEQMDRMKAEERRMRVQRNLPPDPLTATNWTFIGPQPTTVGGSTYSSGRVTSIVVDPRNSLVIYLGAAEGGLWKTTDGGAIGLL